VYLFVSLYGSVCVSLSASISPQQHEQFSPNISCMLPVAVARSFSDGVAIRYVLPLSRMSSCLHITAENRGHRKGVFLQRFNSSIDSDGHLD